MMEWGTIVNRQGRFAQQRSPPMTRERLARQPGDLQSQGLYSNAYSTDDAPLSTARLYTLAQPGHSLWEWPNRIPSAPTVVAPERHERHQRKDLRGIDRLRRRRAAVQREDAGRWSGISGDTACADHEIAKRIRHLAQLDPDKGEVADDITFTSADGAIPLRSPALCQHLAKRQEARRRSEGGRLLTGREKTLQSCARHRHEHRRVRGSRLDLDVRPGGRRVRILSVVGRRCGHAVSCRTRGDGRTGRGSEQAVDGGGGPRAFRHPLPDRAARRGVHHRYPAAHGGTGRCRASPSRC